MAREKRKTVYNNVEGGSRGQCCLSKIGRSEVDDERMVKDRGLRGWRKRQLIARSRESKNERENSDVRKEVGSRPERKILSKKEQGHEDARCR